jgi:galactokinase
VRVCWAVPGRIEVFGKHTDYAGGRSLVCAVPRGIFVEARPAGDGLVVIDDLTVGERAEFSAHGEGPDAGWRCYPRTVIRRLAANFPGADFSARIRVSSDLPQAAGISSSTAFLVGIAEALVDCSGLDKEELWRRVIRTPEDRAGYFGCIENGASYGPLDGDEGFGTHGGSEDHAAIVLSRAGELRQFSYSPIQLEQIVPMPAGWTFVVLSTGVTARKAGSVQAQYNRLSLGTVAIVDAWRTAHPGDDRPLGRLAREGALRGWRPPAELRQRLEHFVAEDARVAEASMALTRCDIAAIGSLAAGSQADADRLLENQIDETRALVQLARDIGAPAASAFGAGWGGSAWALVKAADAAAFLAEWHAAYQQRYPQWASEGFVSPPSAGAHRIQPETARLSGTPSPEPPTPSPETS